MSQEKQDEREILRKRGTKETIEEFLNLVEKKTNFINTAMDMVRQLLKEDGVYIESLRFALRLAINDETLQAIKDEFQEFVELNFSDIYTLLHSIGILVHYGEEHSTDDFLALVEEDKRSKLKSIVEEITSHELYTPLAFRFLRNTNFINGPIECKTMVFRDKITGKDRVYYDIRIPSTIDEFNQKIVRFELDTFEIRLLLDLLAEIIKSNKNENNR